MNKTLDTIHKAAAFIAGALASGAGCVLLTAAILTQHTTRGGSLTESIWGGNAPEYQTADFTNAAKPTDFITGCATDWECEKCGADCEN